MDFCKRHDMNVEHHIEREGLTYLTLMREMMRSEQEAEEKTEPRSSKAASSISEDNKEKKDERSKDEDYEPDKVVKTRQKSRSIVKKVSERYVVKKTNLDASKRVKRILLDDALKNKDTRMSEWSEAR